MAYILNKTNGSIVATVQDATIDLSTDLIFLGRNYAGYGEPQNENFVKLLENFANTIPPTKPLEGEIWYDSAHKRLNFYDSKEWKSVSNLAVSSSNPFNENNPPPSGNLWYNSLEDQLFASNGFEYVLIGPPTGADTQAGWRGSFEQDLYRPGTNIYNIKAVIGAEVVSVVSNQEYVVYPNSNATYPTYVEKTPPLKLYKGINLIGADPTTGQSAVIDAQTGIYSSGNILWGTAAHSINSNSSTYTNGVTFTVDGSNVYKPVSFVTTSSTGRGTLNVDYGFTYNPYTNYVKATRFEGLATSALYADLAERYEADAIYEPGTILVIGGDKEVTVTTIFADTRVAGIVSKNPAYMMNSEAGTDKTHPYIALKGRVPCKVWGPVTKGDLLVTSNIPGNAQAWTAQCAEGSVIAKALNTHIEGFGVIEVLVV